MEKQIIDLRRKKRAKAIAIVFVSHDCQFEASESFRCTGYDIRILLDKKKEGTEEGYREVLLVATRKAKTFDAIISHLLNGPSCDKLYLMDYSPGNGFYEGD